MATKIKESARSEEVRDELRKQGFFCCATGWLYDVGGLIASLSGLFA